MNLLASIIQVALVIAIIPTVLWLFVSISNQVKNRPKADRLNQFIVLLFYKGIIIFIGFGIAFGISETVFYLIAPFIAGSLIYYAGTLE